MSTNKKSLKAKTQQAQSSNPENSTELTKANRLTVLFKTFSSLILAAILIVFIFGDFQIKVLGTDFSLSSVNCWIITETQRSYLKQAEDNLAKQQDYLKDLDAIRQTFPAEERSIALQGRTVTLDTNFGKLPIKMLDQLSPITTENFIILSARGKYNGTTFHRMVQSDSTNLIQGGRLSEKESQDDSIFGKSFQDEITKPSPVPKSCNINTDDLLKNATFKDENYYKTDTEGLVNYKKGWVVMANAGPDTNSSQFFILLGDSKFPPNYTIFGQIAESSFDVLDKIKAEVKPESGSDGQPNKEIKITSATLN